MSRHGDRAEVTRLLHAGDPALSGECLTAQERAAMRRQVLVAAAPRPTASTSLSLRWAFAAALAISLGAWWLHAVSAPPAGSFDPTGSDGTSAREIQFTTPGGTLVVWTLDPDFAL